MAMTKLNSDKSYKVGSCKKKRVLDYLQYMIIKEYHFETDYFSTNQYLPNAPRSRIINPFTRFILAIPDIFEVLK